MTPRERAEEIARKFLIYWEGLDRVTHDAYVRQLARGIERALITEREAAGAAERERCELIVLRKRDLMRELEMAGEEAAVLDDVVLEIRSRGTTGGEA